MISLVFLKPFRSAVDFRSDPRVTVKRTNFRNVCGDPNPSLPVSILDHGRLCNQVAAACLVAVVRICILISRELRYSSKVFSPIVFISKDFITDVKVCC
jgi:hypothetical protein